MRKVRILEQLLHHLGRNQVAFFQRPQNRFAQSLHVLLARLLHIQLVNAILRIEAALKEEIRKPVHQLLQVDVLGRFGCVA